MLNASIMSWECFNLLAGKHIASNRPLFQVLIKLGPRLFVVNSQYSVSLGWLSIVL